MGSIERVDRSKPWRARYIAPDGRRISKSFRRKADAERWLLLEEGDVLAGRWHDPQSGTELFSEYCERWLAERSPTVASKTDYNTEAALRGRILPVFGGERLKELTTKGIRQWLSSLHAEGLSPATVKTYRQILGQVLNQAVADGILTSNPVDAVKTPTVRPRRQLFLNADELERLADAAGDYGPLVAFLGWSGLRFGEAAALKVGKVDAGRRRVRVEESSVRFATPWGGVSSTSSSLPLRGLSPIARRTRSNCRRTTWWATWPTPPVLSTLRAPSTVSRAATPCGLPRCTASRTASGS